MMATLNLYILKGENELFQIKMRKNNIFALFADFEAYEKNLAEMAQKSKSLKFFNM